MNTTEVKVKGIIRSFDDLFFYAKKQFLEYEKLEGIEDWEEHDFSIDCSADQMRFKDMLQIRCVEELTEATHALDNEEHFFEEVTDALNFFLSAYCMLGADLSSFSDPKEILGGGPVKAKKLTGFSGPDRSLEGIKGLYAAFYQIVDAIGDLCNLLKNRPWAQSNYLVSMYDFDLRLSKLWGVFWSVMHWLGLREERIFELFERKYEVNRFRIRSGY